MCSALRAQKGFKLRSTNAWRMLNICTTNCRGGRTSSWSLILKWVKLWVEYLLHHHHTVLLMVMSTTQSLFFLLLLLLFSWMWRYELFFLSRSIVTCVSGTPRPVWPVCQLDLKKRPSSIRWVQTKSAFCLDLWKTFMSVSLQLAPQIKARMMERGTAMIGYQPLGSKVNFFRCVLSNPATQREDIHFLLEQIVQLGCDLWCPKSECTFHSVYLWWIQRFTFTNMWKTFKPQVEAWVKKREHLINHPFQMF